MRNRLFLFFAGLICSCIAMAEHSLVITKLTMQEQRYALDKIGQVTFDSKKMYLWDRSGNMLGSTKFKNISTVTFVEGTAGTEDPEDPEKPKDPDNPDDNDGLQSVNSDLVRIYPNPAQEKVIITGLTGQTVRLYSLDGQVVTTVRSEGSTVSLSVGQLPSGVYVLQAGAELLKLIKD